MTGWWRAHPERVAAGLVGLAAALWFGCALPDPLFEHPLSTVVLARDGGLLGARIADDGQWRFPPGTQLPLKFQQALVLAEDKRFFSHAGIDPLALGRALRLNLRHGDVVSGGSTITMQVVRLARRNPARTYFEKFVEATLALRLEITHSKQEILALYASHAPFGGNVVGIEAAAWRYFGRAPDELSWAEAATLAVLPNSPGLIHPARGRAALHARRDALLKRLHARGQMNDLDLQLALVEPLPGRPLDLPQEAPHLLETLRARHPGQHRFHTTLDAHLQRSARDSLERHAEMLARQHIGNAALVIADHRNFEVLAYVGNARWSVDNEQGFAVDIVQRPRSTGSLLKPFLYAAMLDAGEILPTTLVPDIPTQVGGYIPENFDRAFRGAVPAREALAQSLNVPAVRMLRLHGVERFHAGLRQLGMTTLNRAPEHYGLTLILGGAEGTLWDLAGMYANLAELARRQTPGPETTRRRLKLLIDDTGTEARTSGITPGAAWLSLQALLEVTRPAEEANWRSFGSARKIAWKTGTSYGFRDAWAIGLNGHYLSAVWVGNASGEGRPGLTGSLAAAPLLFETFNLVSSSDWFAPPTAWMKQVNVCRDDGYLANGDCVAEQQWIPAHSHFDTVSPYHRRIHLDRDGRYRVHGACESPGRMQHRDWFVLPPGQEYYYRKTRASYRPLPPYRPDCLAGADEARAPMDFLYPNAGTRIYIPVDLAEKKSRVIFEAVHRNTEARLHWHLNERFLGTTQRFHQQALDIAPGDYLLTVVDQDGNRLSRHFEVLGKNAGTDTR